MIALVFLAGSHGRSSGVLGSEQAAIPSVTPPGSESRRLITAWPSNVRVGDSASIMMVLEPGIKAGPGQSGDTGLNSSAQDEGTLGDLYGAYQVIAQARLELAGIETRPSGEINEALLPGEPVRFNWSLRPAQAGVYQGTIWLHLLFIPRAGSEELRKVITAQVIEIKAEEFLGLDGSSARILGSIGLVLGCLIAFDDYVFNLTRRLFGKSPTKENDEGESTKNDSD